MFKQIYNRENGKPELIESDSEGVFKFNKFLYTDVAPTSDLYEPMYFNGNEWVGSTKEEYESNQDKPPIEPKDTDFLNAQLISNDIENNAKIEALQQDIANLTNELLKMKGEMSDVPNS